MRDVARWQRRWKSRDIMKSSSGWRARYKPRGGGGRKSTTRCASPSIRKSFAGDESNLVRERDPMWANWYRPSSTFRVTIYTSSALHSALSQALKCVDRLIRQRWVLTGGLREISLLFQQINCRFSGDLTYLIAKRTKLTARRFLRRRFRKATQTEEAETSKLTSLCSANKIRDQYFASSIDL